MKISMPVKPGVAQLVVVIIGFIFAVLGTILHITSTPTVYGPAGPQGATGFSGPIGPSAPLPLKPFFEYTATLPFDNVGFDELVWVKGQYMQELDKYFQVTVEMFYASLLPNSSRPVIVDLTGLLVEGTFDRTKPVAIVGFGGFVGFVRNVVMLSDNRILLDFYFDTSIVNEWAMITFGLALVE